MHTQHFGSLAGLLVGGANFHDNEINVGLYPRDGRTPTGVTTGADAHVTNGAGYAQESLSFYGGRFLLGGGLRCDEFRFNVADKVNPDYSGVQADSRYSGLSADGCGWHDNSAARQMSAVSNLSDSKSPRRIGGLAHPQLNRRSLPCQVHRKRAPRAGPAGQLHLPVMGFGDPLDDREA